MFGIEPTLSRSLVILLVLVFSVLSLLQTFPMVGEAPKDWVELYRSALMELDHAQLPQKIEIAYRAIEQRIYELLQEKNAAQEHLALEDALRNLRSLKRQTE